MSTVEALRNPPSVLNGLGWDNFPNPTSQPCAPLEFGTAVFKPSDEDWCTKTNTSGVWRLIYHDEIELEDFASPTAAKVANDVVEEPYEVSELDLVLSMVRELDRLEAGWDEPDTPAPTEDLIDDALVVLQNWPMSDLIPEPTVGHDGHIALELYDNDGFVLGGVELTGERSALYSIVQRTEVLFTGRFDTTSQSEMINALSRIKQHFE